MYMERRPLADQRLPNVPPQHPTHSSSTASHCLNLDDLPQLKQQMLVDAQQYERKAAALEQSIHGTIRMLQASLKSVTHRAETLETQLAAAIASQREALQRLDAERARHALSQQQVASLQEALEAQARNTAAQHAQRDEEDAQRQQDAAFLAEQEDAVRAREAALDAREASFASAMAPAQADIDRLRARAQELEAEAKRRVEEAQRLSEAAMARKYEADRHKRSVEEWSELQLAELAHRHRLWVDALADQEHVIEHRALSCAALEARLGQWASEVNVEAAARERVRLSELDAQAEALAARKHTVEVQERALRNARRVLESERLELLNVVQEEEANWLEEGSGSDEQRRRLLVRLRRVRSLIDRTTAAASPPPPPSTMISEASAATSASTSVHSAHGSRIPESNGEGDDGSEQRQMWQRPFRTPSSTSLTGSSPPSSWMQPQQEPTYVVESSLAHRVSSSSASSTTVVGLSARPSTLQRLQRSTPERRTIASPLKLRGAGGSDGPLT